MRSRSGPEAGLTLVEFTLVAALGALVVLSLAIFYLGAQNMWLGSSVQAVTQRDASMFVDEMARVIATADTVEMPTPSQPGHLALSRGGVQIAEILWNPGSDRATITTAIETGNPRVEPWPATGRIRSLQFRIESLDPRMVWLDSLRVETPVGEPLFLSSCFGLYNKQ